MPKVHANLYRRSADPRQADPWLKSVVCSTWLVEAWCRAAERADGDYEARYYAATRVVENLATA